ncbi:MAG: MFS transporter [Campylobacterota bacterium]|nr:MFS transporter [Campylobacterota bacterium]
MPQKENFQLDSKSNHRKNVLHGFFMALGMTIAEPHTILPLIISYFGGGSILIGLLSSLLKGGAIIVQLYAAFHAQAYPYVLKYLRRVFLARFTSWFFIGVMIFIFGEDNHDIALFGIGLGLFLFSFSAGFGAIYFKEMNAKIFSNKFRGKSMAVRQFFAGFAAIISGAGAAYILEVFEPPYSYAWLFMISALLMGAGLFAFGTVSEPKKINVSKKEKSFRLFLQNANKLLKTDKDLQVQIATFLLAYSYLFALPFIIIDAQSKIDLDGVAIGSLITAQMVGAMLSNIVWGRLSSIGHNKTISNITIIMTIVSISISFFANSLSLYMLIFFLVGASMDGNRIASSNLIILIAPEEKRPVYNALQTNITSIGMFFSLFGGMILHFTSYNFLYGFTIIMLFASLYFSLKLKKG